MVFLGSQVSSRGLVERFGEKVVMVGGISLSTTGMVLLTQLNEHSGYLALVVPLLIFGAGNGLAFVPLTTAALDKVAPEDSGAASGLVNVMQQVGGSLGLSVLVTVFGTASSNAADNLRPGLSAAEASRHVFVAGAHSAFWAASVFLMATWLLVAFAIRRRPAVKDVDYTDVELEAELQAVLAE